MNSQILFDYALKNGYVLFVLLICSVFAFKVIIEKFISFYAIEEKFTSKIFAGVKALLLAKNHGEATIFATTTLNDRLNKKTRFKVYSPLGKIVKYMVENSGMIKSELIDRSLNQVDKQFAILEKRLGVLATLGNITPFIGLFGTVLGIIRAFNALSMNDASSYTNLMAGIAEALISTAAGLFVAIPSVMFYNFFVRKLKNVLPQFEEAVLEIADILSSDREQ